MGYGRFEGFGLGGLLGALDLGAFGLLGALKMGGFWAFWRL